MSSAIDTDVLFLVLLFEQLLAHSIDGFALLVHHVVVLEDVFSGREVLAFDPFLRRFDLFGNHPGFDRHAFLHAEALHDARNTVGREDPHQVVFERHKETR